MSIDKRWRLICYDIRDVKRYRKVFKLLRGAGRSVQYSIFRARLDDRETEQLRWELSRLMAPEDSLLIIDLCPRCASTVVSRNHVEGWTTEPASFTIIGDSHSEHEPARRPSDHVPGGVRKAEPKSDDNVLKSLGKPVTKGSR
ncbi:MAG: CRISPR-associated endonuclease Cas2 [Polyangiaceae bacterium]